MKNLKYKTNLIDILLKTENLSKAEFCKKCNIKETTLKKIYNHQDCSLLTLYKITNFMHLSLQQFFYK